MELYIEKAFIDDLYLDVNLNKPSFVQEIIIRVFKEYGEVEKFMDVVINTPEDLATLKSSNILIAHLSSYFPPLPVKSIKEHFFKHSLCKQTLIFTQNTEDWFVEAEAKGALCFSLETFQQRIKKIIDDVNALNIDIDDMPNDWNVLSCLQQIPFNAVVICDNYILTDKSNQRLNQNIIPLLKTVLLGKETQIIPIQVLTSDFNPLPPRSTEQINSSVSKKHRMLNTAFGNFKTKFTIFSTSHSGGFDLHGRELLNNFVLIRSGEGFNLMPRRQRSNEVLTAGTIFNKSDYNKIKKRLKLYNDFTAYLRRLETMNFKIYP